MTVSQTFTILGPPVGEGRPRAVRMGPLGVRLHAAPKSAEWRALAAQQMRSERGDTIPVDVTVSVAIEAVMPRPGSIPKKRGMGRIWRACKPDIDNIEKAVFDALTTAGVITDDRQIVRTTASKPTAAVGETPRVVITVEASP